MARPKGKLFALLAVFAAIGLVAASGAFTSVQAERTVDVNTAGDASALLALDSAGGGNSDYVSGSSGEISINLNTTGAAGASGINENALTDVDNLITITNQGTQEVEAYIVMDKSGSDLTSNFNNSVNFTVDSSSGGVTSAPDQLDRASDDDAAGSVVTLPTGESVTFGLEIDLRDVDVSGSSDTILDDITVVANATS